MSSSTPAPTPHYLKSEPQASVSLRLLANALNGTAYKSFLSPKINSPPHIGFDLEWKPSYRPGAENPIAVIQIAYKEASYVIHISWMRDIPDGLAEILENPRIVKVGVGIQHDAKKLFKDLGVCLNSCVDLSLFVKCVDSGLFAERLDRYADIPLQSSTVIPDPPPPSSPGDVLTAYYASEAFLGPHIHRLFRGSYNTSIGLARLTEMYTGIVLTKGRITKSNWEAVLTEAQIRYAALDAYAGYIVYTHLINLYNLLSQKPMRRFYAFDCIRGTLYHCSGDTSRTLPAQRIEDPDYPLTSSSNMDSSPVFRSVWDEISLHIQGIGEDQPRGLIRWTQSNPEFDTGPMPHQRTKEEKEAARIERKKKKKEEKQREDEHNSSLQTHMAKLGQRNATENVAKSMIAPNMKPQQQAAKVVKPPRAPRMSRGNVPLSESIASITTSMQAVKMVQPPRAPTVSRPPSERQGKSEAMVMTTVGATASAGASKPPGYVPPSERITTSTQATKVVPPPRAPTVSRPPSERQGKSEVVVMTTASATASAGVLKPPGKNKQKRPQTKPRLGPNTVSHPTTSVVSISMLAPKKTPFNPQRCQRGNWEGDYLDYLGAFPELKGYGHLKCRECGVTALEHP